MNNIRRDTIASIDVASSELNPNFKTWHTKNSLIFDVLHNASNSRSIPQRTIE
jgi:hypothetical protein